MAYAAGRCLLLQILKNKGWSQQDLADRAGIMKQQINRYCLNKTKMSLDTALNIALTIGCNVEDLHEIVLVESPKS